MFRSSGSDKFQSKPYENKKCCCVNEYQEQIEILQQKLMQTHNKLIQQLDVCRQQQLTIIQLTKKLMILQQSTYNIDSQRSFSSSQNNGDVSNGSKQYIRADLYANKGNQFTLNNSNLLLASNYNSPTFLENNRNQLLKSDLEAMRMKLLQQITQKQELKLQLNQLKLTFNQKTSEYKKQINNLQNDHNYLLKQYDYIKKSIDKHQNKKDSFQQKSYSSDQFKSISQKCNEYERLYRKQINLNQELNRKIVEYKSMISSYKQQISELQNQIEKYNNCVKSTSTAADGLKQQRQRQQLCRQQLCGTIRISRNPGSLFEKQNMKRVKLQTNSGQITFTDTQIFKRRSTLAEITNSRESAKQMDRKDTSGILKQKRMNVDLNKERGLKEKQKNSFSSNKQSYESTKQLIKKLEQAEMLTRQKKKNVYA